MTITYKPTYTFTPKTPYLSQIIDDLNDMRHSGIKAEDVHVSRTVFDILRLELLDPGNRYAGWESFNGGLMIAGVRIIPGDR